MYCLSGISAGTLRLHQFISYSIRQCVAAVKATVIQVDGFPRSRPALEGNLIRARPTACKPPVAGRSRVDHHPVMASLASPLAPLPCVSN